MVVEYMAMFLNPNNMNFKETVWAVDGNHPWKAWTSGRDAACPESTGKTGTHVGQDTALWQPGPVPAAPDKQTVTATLPQHGSLALQDTGQEDLLQRRWRAEIPVGTRKGLPEGRCRVLQGSYP